MSRDITFLEELGFLLPFFSFFLHLPGAGSCFGERAREREKEREREREKTNFLPPLLFSSPEPFSHNRWLLLVLINFCHFSSDSSSSPFFLPFFPPSASFLSSSTIRARDSAAHWISICFCLQSAQFLIMQCRQIKSRCVTLYWCWLDNPLSWATHWVDNYGRNCATCSASTWSPHIYLASPLWFWKRQFLQLLQSLTDTRQELRILLFCKIHLVPPYACSVTEKDRKLSHFPALNKNCIVRWPAATRQGDSIMVCQIN
jgi:hypothetical protein